MIKFNSIAIDGPAGSGKSTIAKKLASILQYDYISSGSFYRVIAYVIIENKITVLNDSVFTTEFFEKINIQWDKGQIILNSKNVTNIIREDRYANLSSLAAIYQPVRDFVNQIIHGLSHKHNIVVDGRDIGTLVLPHAILKIFLDANIDVRAERVLQHNIDLGLADTNLMEIKTRIAKRDQRDYERAIAPLAVASDAIIIDASHLTVQEVVDEIIILLHKRTE